MSHSLSQSPYPCSSIIDNALINVPLIIHLDRFINVPAIINKVDSENFIYALRIQTRLFGGDVLIHDPSPMILLQRETKNDTWKIDQQIDTCILISQLDDKAFLDIDLISIETDGESEQIQILTSTKLSLFNPFLRQGIQYLVMVTSKVPNDQNGIEFDMLSKGFEYRLETYGDHPLVQTRLEQLIKDHGMTVLIVSLPRFDYPRISAMLDQRPLTLGNWHADGGRTQSPLSVPSPFQGWSNMVASSNHSNTLSLESVSVHMAILHRLLYKPLTWSMTAQEKRLLWRYKDILGPQFTPRLLILISSMTNEKIGVMNQPSSPSIHPSLKITCPLQVIELIHWIQHTGSQKITWWDRLLDLPTKLSESNVLEVCQLMIPQLIDLAAAFAPGPKQFLAERVGDWLQAMAQANSSLSRSIYWHTRMAVLRETVSMSGASILPHALLLQSLPSRPHGHRRQESFVKRLALTVRRVRDLRLPRPQQAEAIKQLLTTDLLIAIPLNPNHERHSSSPNVLHGQHCQHGEHHNHKHQAMYLPYDWEHSTPLDKLLVEETLVFKSKAMPVKLSFSTLANIGQDSGVSIIFKLGEDLRQDMFVMQVIKLLDILWKANAGLDLYLTPYPVLSTGLDHGIMQYVPSASLAQLLENPNGSGNDASIRSILRYIAGSKGWLDRFTASCAGYCIITYLLGIGDRHLDNLLLTPSGILTSHVYSIASF